MSAPEHTVLQVNFKTPRGSLINGYATSVDHLDVVLSELEGRIPMILAIEEGLNGGVAHQQAVANVVQAFPQATVVSTPPVPTAPAPVAAAPVQAQAAPTCDHGQPAKYVKGGIAKASGKPYPAFYACAMPRESQCGFRQTA